MAVEEREGFPVRGIDRVEDTPVEIRLVQRERIQVQEVQTRVAYDDQRAARELHRSRGAHGSCAALRRWFFADTS